jgi:excisionase family DNA binding protein
MSEGFFRWSSQTSSTMTCVPFHRVLCLAALVPCGTLAVALSCAAAERGSHLDVLDLDDAALLLRVKPEVVRELAERHDIPARRVGEVWRFSRAALLEWLKDAQPAGTLRASPGPPGNVDRGAALTGELAAISGRGAAPEPSSPLAQAVSDTKPSADAPPPAIGERPARPTAEEMALRDERVLLKRGAATIDFGASYSYGEQASFPVIRQEQRSLVANVIMRYGVLNDLQITARIPGVWSRTSIFTDAAISGTTAPLVTRKDYAGDASVSLLGVALRETVGRPNILWTFDSVVPSGPGDRGLGGGLVLSKSYDPAVVFAGLSYLYGFSVDPADSRRSLAQFNMGMSLGYSYALNDSLALNTLFTGTYRNTSSPDGVSIPPPRERYQLQLGMTWLLARGVFMEPSVAMGLGSQSPSITVSLNIPYSF